MDIDYGRWSENFLYGWGRKYVCICGYIWILFLSFYWYVNIEFVLCVDMYMDIEYIYFNFMK